MQVLLDTQTFYIATGMSEEKFPAKVTKLLADPETELIDCCLVN